MKYIKQLCCYIGCKREYDMRLDLIPLPTVEEIEEACRTGKTLPDDDQFADFGIFECEGRLYCTEDYLCPWHDGDCPSKCLFAGCLCDEHFESFRGPDYGDYFRNIAKADPELFDRTRQS